MANLVRPVNYLPPTEDRIIEFKGLDRKHTVPEGEMSDMLNLSSDAYPILTQRKARGTMALPEGVVRPLQILSRFERIALIAKTADDIFFYYDGVKIDAVTGLSESTRMVAINKKLCFFPEKTYLEIFSDGRIGQYGSLAVDHEATAAVVTLTNEDVQMDAVSGLGYDDAINLVGTLSYTAGGESRTAACNASCIIETVSDGKMILPRETFIEMTGEDATGITFTGHITRSVPDLDMVIEWNNRLWGANSEDNTIYACKLGDPKNWQYYQGTSLDSYYAEQGTDGVWTGVALYSNHLIFFKQNSMCRIYGTAPSNFQLTNTEVFGVEYGSRQSVVTINDTVFYKSKIGIMAYSGGIPYCISDNLGIEFRSVVAGTEKRKYYASLQKKSGGYELVVFDIAKGLWHKEDSTRFRSCATVGDKLYYVQYETDLLVCSENLPCSEWTLVGSDSTRGNVGIINPDSPTEDAESMKWKAVFGPFDEYLEEHKIYSKLALRLIATGNASAKVYIAIDEQTHDAEEYEKPMLLEGTNVSISNPERAYTPETNVHYARVNIEDTEGSGPAIVCLYFGSMDEIPEDAEILSVTAKLGAKGNVSLTDTVLTTRSVVLCNSAGYEKSKERVIQSAQNRETPFATSDYTFAPSDFKGDNGAFFRFKLQRTNYTTAKYVDIYGASLTVTYRTKWEKVEEYPQISTKGDFIPIVPRRCDRYSVMIDGKGPCEIKTLTRRVRKGSFGRL